MPLQRKGVSYGPARVPIAVYKTSLSTSMKQTFEILVCTPRNRKVSSLGIFPN